MAVKLISGGGSVPSITSPPPLPAPYPPDELIAKKVVYGDREILVTVPFPDTIVLVTDVMNHHLNQPYEAGAGSIAWIAKQIDADLKQYVSGYSTGETHFSPKPEVTGSGQRKKVVYRLDYDPDHPLHVAHLQLSRQETEGYGWWTIKLDFSVSKAGPVGLAKLTALLEDALQMNVKAILGSMRVQRINPAIDLIGAEPLDLIPHVPKPGKRMIYVGDHGRPESVYLYAKKAPLKQPPQTITKRTTGPLRLKLYERQSYFEQLKLDPPYGECPVTRAEVQSDWKQKKKQPWLANLATLPNRLLKRRIAYAAAVGPQTGNASSAWVQFCLAAFGGGVRKTQAKTGPGQGLHFRKLYEDCSGDLADENAWTRWADGLAFTGLDQWVEIAKANPPPEL